MDKDRPAPKDVRRGGGRDLKGCTMRERYTFEISTRGQEGLWKVVVRQDETFTRNPDDIARALVERWIIGNRRHLSGGERIIVRHPHADQRRGDLHMKVRVRVFKGGLDSHSPSPVAIAYLGHNERDYPAARPVGPRSRLLSRLRLPRQRTGSPTDIVAA